MLVVNEGRFLTDLNALAAIGKLPDTHGGGRDRRAFSPAERQARRLFIDLAEHAGLAVRTDPAANLSAVLRAEIDDAPTLLVGSHMDTVPNGGPYDGALGVIAGLETLRRLQEAGTSLPFALECIAFTDEEGRYCGLTGSQLLAGTYSRAATERFLAAFNEYPADVAAMAELVPGDLSVNSMMAAHRPAESILGFVELHIEQGPRLEQTGKTIGVVDAIFGRVSFQVVFEGRSDHAGTTPMNLRADALTAAARFVVPMSDFVRGTHPDAVFTCGGITVQPGADNVVPREARLLVEYRANSAAILNSIGEEVDKCLAENTRNYGVRANQQDYHRLEPRPMDADIRAAIAESSHALGYPTMTLSSGALHDAHSLAAVAPAGMIFVPSKGGRSHCPEEDTDPSDLVAGANVLLQTVVRLADRELVDTNR